MCLSTSVTMSLMTMISVLMTTDDLYSLNSCIYLHLQYAYSAFLSHTPKDFETDVISMACAIFGQTLPIYALFQLKFQKSQFLIGQLKIAQVWLTFALAHLTLG